MYACAAADQCGDGERVVGMHRCERIRFKPPICFSALSTWTLPGAPGGGGAAGILTRTEDANKTHPAQLPPPLFCPVPTGEKHRRSKRGAQHPRMGCTYTHRHAVAPPPLRLHPSSCSPNQKATRSSHHVSLVISLCLWLPLFPSSTFTLISSFSFI